MRILTAFSAAWILSVAATAATTTTRDAQASLSRLAVAAPDDELPDGPGRKLLQRACLHCHELTEVTKFKGYWSRAQWRDIVVTMVEYGAPLSTPEIDTLADYLVAHLGRR